MRTEKRQEHQQQQQNKQKARVSSSCVMAIIPRSSFLTHEDQVRIAHFSIIASNAQYETLL
jgi:hypothetical protein